MRDEVEWGLSIERREREEVCYVAKGGMTSRAMGLVPLSISSKHAHSPDRNCSSLIPEVQYP